MISIRTRAGSALAALALAAHASAYPVTTWTWTPSPTTDALGDPLLPAVSYEVFLVRDSRPESLVASVPDTFWQTDAAADPSCRLAVRGVDALGRRSTLSAASDPWQSPPLSAVPESRGPTVGPAYPNPFNPRTSIAYTVPDVVHGPVDLQVLDVRGRAVRRLAARATPGEHRARWDGADDHGRPLASGVYLVRLRCGAAVAVTKITLMR